MPKNKGKGGKNRRRGKNENVDDVKRELIFKDEGQAYAQVVRMLGGGNVEALCFGDNKKRICHIRGKFRKKVWINKSDIILVGLRSYEDDKADIIYKYTLEEARQLQYKKEIPENINITEAAEFGQDAVNENIFFDEQNGDDGEDGSDDDEEEQEIDDDDDDGYFNNGMQINNPNRRKGGNLNRQHYTENSDDDYEEETAEDKAINAI